MPSILMIRNITMLLTAIIFPAFILAQSTSDTLFRYEDGRMLIKSVGRFELKKHGVVIDWWEEMDKYLTVDYKSYHLIRRKEGGQWKTGLFKRNDGTLYLAPKHDRISELFGSDRLVLIKDSSGFQMFSLRNGAHSKDGLKTVREFASGWLGFGENAMFAYDKNLLLIDSIAGACTPVSQATNGYRYFMFLSCGNERFLMDDQFKKTPRTEWTGIERMAGSLLLVSAASGIGVFHITQNKLITPLDHMQNLYEFNEHRFMLFKGDQYILYDSTGKITVKVAADGMVGVNDIGSFFYRQGGVWGIMNEEGKVLMKPSLDHFELSKAPVGQFYARVKGAKIVNQYAWTYTEKNGARRVTGIKLLGEYKENLPVTNPFPNNPVDAKN